MEAELVVGFQLLSESYISRVTLEPERRITVRFGGSASLFFHCREREREDKDSRTKDAHLFLRCRVVSLGFSSAMPPLSHSSPPFATHFFEMQAVAADTQLFRHLQNEWLVEPGRIPGTTDVTFRIDFAFRSALHARAAALFHEEVASKMVDAYVKRCATLTASKKPFDARGVSFDHSTASTLLRSTSARGEGLHELHREFGRASFGPTVILAAAERRTFSIATSAAPANGKVGPPSAVRPIAPPKSPSSRPMSGGGGSPLARTLTSPSSTSTSSHTASEKKRPVLPLTPSPW